MWWNWKYTIPPRQYFTKNIYSASIWENNQKNPDCETSQTGLESSKCQSQKVTRLGDCFTLEAKDRGQKKHLSASPRLGENYCEEKGATFWVRVGKCEYELYIGYMDVIYGYHAYIGKYPCPYKVHTGMLRGKMSLTLKKFSTNRKCMYERKNDKLLTGESSTQYLSYYSLHFPTLVGTGKIRCAILAKRLGVLAFDKYL